MFAASLFLLVPVACFFCCLFTCFVPQDDAALLAAKSQAGLYLVLFVLLGSLVCFVCVFAFVLLDLFVFVCFAC